jgi:hypothetical protein
MHTAHSPNGIPGEGGLVAEHLIAAAREELHHRDAESCDQPIRRHATEPYLHLLLVSLFKGLPRSQSLRSEQQYNTFLPVFERDRTLPKVYSSSCQMIEYGVPWSLPLRYSPAGSLSILLRLTPSALTAHRHFITALCLNRQSWQDRNKRRSQRLIELGLNNDYRYSWLCEVSPVNESLPANLFI